MQKVVNQHVLEQRISKHREVVLKQVTFHAIFEAKRLNSPFALLHFRGEIPGESLILWYCRCGTGSCSRGKLAGGHAARAAPAASPAPTPAAAARAAARGPAVRAVKRRGQCGA